MNVANSGQTSYCSTAAKCYAGRCLIKWTQIIWDPLPDGNVEEHDLTTDDVDHVLQNYESRGTSKSSGRPCVYGHTPDGRHIVVIYEEVDDDTVIPVTTYEVPERRRKRK